MFIVGDSLKALCLQHQVCSISLVDEFSLSVRLGQRFYRPQRVEVPIPYGRVASVEAHYESVCAAEMTLAPQEAVLASSRDHYAMPVGCLGLLHTKGTLARLFVCVQCADPQVEPGFKGQLTMELVNHAPFPVTLCAGAIVGQLYVGRCSTITTPRYAGRYQNAVGPTLPILE